VETFRPYLDYGLWAVTILVALIIALVIWRAFNQRVRGRRGQRLGISEYQELDQTRRLVLVRRDNVEHLLLIGGPADLVVESGIGAGKAVFAPPASENPDDTGRQAPLRPAPRAPGFGERRAVPQFRAEPTLDEPAP
jgi:Meckel syndrome type 1 protein